MIAQELNLSAEHATWWAQQMVEHALAHVDGSHPGALGHLKACEVQLTAARRLLSPQPSPQRASAQEASA